MVSKLFVAPWLSVCHLCIGTENLPYHWFYVSDPSSEKREKQRKIYLTHQIVAVSLNLDLNNSVFHVR